MHYNPILHERQGELVLSEDVPEWVAPPPKRKRTEQIQERTGGESEDDEAGHKQEDETRRKRVKSTIQSAEAAQKKRKPSDNESDLNAQEHKNKNRKRKSRHKLVKSKQQGAMPAPDASTTGYRPIRPLLLSVKRNAGRWYNKVSVRNTIVKTRASIFNFGQGTEAASAYARHKQPAEHLQGWRRCHQQNY
jgi:hypothetical protein